MQQTENSDTHSQENSKVIGATVGQEPKTSGGLNIYQSLKRALSRRPQNPSQRCEETATVSASAVKDPSPQRRTLASVQLPDREICVRCKALKKGSAFEELEALQETCERRETDGSPCFVPVSVVQPGEQLIAFRMELAKVPPTAQLRGRSSRYILVRCDSQTESSSQAIYSQVLYDSISRSPSRSPSLRRPVSLQASSINTPSECSLLSTASSRCVYLGRSRSRSRSRSPSVPIDYGRVTAQISGAQEATATTASGDVPKLK